ncbi:hypothetical protein GCM10009680_58570 [Streptomyces yatensis]|uniref:Uncharacterized protein n=1 Tax=Streptomyces yatensis TaxID=155177 RepID=A0ABN2IRD6_9ACTN
MTILPGGATGGQRALRIGRAFQRVGGADPHVELAGLGELHQRREVRAVHPAEHRSDARCPDAGDGRHACAGCHGVCRRREQAAADGVQDRVHAIGGESADVFGGTVAVGDRLGPECAQVAVVAW